MFHRNTIVEMRTFSKRIWWRISLFNSSYPRTRNFLIKMRAQAKVSNVKASEEEKRIVDKLILARFI
jgi:hypothetical protein